jgi:serine/threonine protein kinase/tetratricopeptide (TPR) repeat protein
MRIENIIPKIERTFLATGSTLGKYRIIEEIDRGGMAVVYKATQLDLDRVVALKVLPANITINRSFVDRFLSEAHAVAKLTHAGIVSIHEVAMEDNVYFLAMDYIPGRNLYYHLHLAKPRLAEVLEIVAGLGDALGYAHRKGIIHRDLKLNNVIMRDNKVPVLIDFGLAKAMEKSEGGTLTQTGEIVGSPAYMAPERLLGQDYDLRSDICSLGIMLYEMLTFKNPYLDPRSIHQTTMNVLDATPLPLRKLVPWLPAEIEAITLMAMARDPAKRYQTMDDFAGDIRRYLKGERVIARSPTLWWHVTHFFRKFWAVSAIGSILFTFSALFLAFLYVQGTKEKPHWQLVFEETFSDSLQSDQWSRPPPPDSSWGVRGGRLQVDCAGLSYIRLERSLTRDVMIEFDLAPTDTDVCNVGLFLCGNSPDSAYSVYLHRQGTAECGISYLGSSLLLHDADPAELPAAPVYHVVVKKSENQISLTVNDMPVAVLWDYFPLLGKNHQKIGFFAKGTTCGFDNLKVSRLAMPQLSGPSLVADRFWERGEFEGALEEYQGLLVDFPRSRTGGDVQMRIADCFIRTGRYTRADKVLADLWATPQLDERLRPLVRFMQGVVLQRTGGMGAAADAYAGAAGLAPFHTVNQSSLAYLSLAAADSLAQGRFAAVESLVTSLPTAFPVYTRQRGRLCCLLLEHLLRAQAYDRVIALEKKMERLYEGDPLVLSYARYAAGRAHLNKREMRAAADLLNSCAGGTGQAAIEASWHAWMTLAEIYESEFRYKDAIAIYRKVSQECPKSTPIAWMARIKTGDVGRFVEGAESCAVVCRQVASERQPFPLPRHVAMLYSGTEPEQSFRSWWTSQYGDDPEVYYYLAKAAAIGDRAKAAVDYLKQLKSRTSFYTFRYVELDQALKNIKQW